MTEEQAKRLLELLEHLHNNTETMALALLMLPPPLIHVALPEEGANREGMLRLVAELQVVYQKASASITERYARSDD